MKYPFILLLISCLCACQVSLACRCSPLPKLDSLAQLSTYQFIAHVVITDDGDSAVITNRQDPGTLKFNIITLFKGQANHSCWNMKKTAVVIWRFPKEKSGLFSAY